MLGEIEDKYKQITSKTIDTISCRLSIEALRPKTTGGSFFQNKNRQLLFAFRNMLNSDKSCLKNKKPEVKINVFDSR